MAHAAMHVNPNDISTGLTTGRPDSQAVCNRTMVSPPTSLSSSGVGELSRRSSVSRQSET
jgi:hypothetical protein